MLILIGLKKCSTCKDVEKILKEKGLEYIYREIDKDKPNAEEIKRLHKLSGLPINKHINTSGLLYKSMGLKDKIGKMTQDEIYNLLSTDGMLLKRPILINGDEVFVGNDVQKYINGKVDTIDDLNITDLKISQPAIRALMNFGIKNLSQVQNFTEKDLLDLHGFGPKGLKILKEYMEKHNISFKK